MTRQQMFDRVWQHFVVEKGPQSGTPMGCQYRARDGAKCALGLLIPDGLYLPEMEGRPAQGLIGRYPELARHLMDGFDGDVDVLKAFTRALQQCHDDAVEEAACEDEICTFHEMVEDHLRRVGAEHDLTIPA
jgi:hypothetical protein